MMQLSFPFNSQWLPIAKIDPRGLGSYAQASLKKTWVRQCHTHETWAASQARSKSFGYCLVAILDPSK